MVQMLKMGFFFGNNFVQFIRKKHQGKLIVYKSSTGNAYMLCLQQDHILLIS